MKVFRVGAKGDWELMDIEDSLQRYYELIDCRCIDIVERKVGGRWFDIICDDEALLKEDLCVTAMDKNGESMLCGNLIFCHHDEDGDLVGLEDGDEEVLLSKFRLAVDWQGDLYKVMEVEDE